MKTDEDMFGKQVTLSCQFTLRSPFHRKKFLEPERRDVLPSRHLLFPDLQPSTATRPESAACSSTSKKTIIHRNSKCANEHPPPAKHGALSRQDSVTSYGFNIDDMNLSDSGDSDGEESGCEKYFGQRIYEACCCLTGVSPIQSILSHLDNVRLCVQNRAVTAADIKPLAVSLVSNPHVRFLDLSCNMIGCKGALYVSDLLRENAFISQLDLSENLISSDGVASLCRALRRNKTLLVLRIAGNSLRDADSVYVAEILMKNCTLQELDVSHNKLGIRSGAILGKAISKNSTLIKLDLSWNLLRLRSGQIFCTALKFNTGLKSVNLRFNGLALDGCLGLKKALATNTTLTELNISHNRIDAQALIIFLEGLEQNTGLQILQIGDNPIHMSPTTSILRAIRKNTNSTLKHLDLTHVSVESQFIEELQFMNDNLHVLHVTHDVIHSNKHQKLKSKRLYSLEDPLTLLYRYIQEQNLRIVDIFNAYDEDKSMTLDREEFTKGLKKSGIHIPANILEKMLKKLDSNGDGQIDLSELIDGYAKVRRKFFKQKIYDQMQIQKRGLEALTEVEDKETKQRLLSQFTSTLSAESFLPSLNSFLIT